MPSSNTYGAGWSAGPKSEYEDLEMPSGTLAKMRKPSPKRLVTLGLLDDFDQLTSIVNEKHIQRVKGKPAEKAQFSQADINAMAQDPKKIRTVLDMADKIMEYMVVEPVIVRPVYEDENGVERKLLPNEREDGVIYTDYVDEIDKMYIFIYSVGSSADLESFRRSIEQSSGAVGDGGEVSLSPVRTVKRKS